MRSWWNELVSHVSRRKYMVKFGRLDLHYGLLAFLDKRTDY
jgi:hypothetical protein